ncbi:PREDICTED: uncharacterized protein LOC109160812 [Ipomoea nil]|uniref:uncharacterized protein LOC109160812 n=1 Tax=Ipomoea nil TaxID=35883 RepID=UPI000901E444|nr:PREDICTED: uncharacterized protein LOC109160812 [Ipomoea nil]
MFASQLSRILQALPADVNYETCSEEKTSTKENQPEIICISNDGKEAADLFSFGKKGVLGSNNSDEFSKVRDLDCSPESVEKNSEGLQVKKDDPNGLFHFIARKTGEQIVFTDICVDKAGVPCKVSVESQKDDCATGFLALQKPPGDENLAGHTAISTLEPETEPSQEEGNPELQEVANSEEKAKGNRSITSRGDEYGEGEASFSGLGSVTYSGLIPYSGSISVRSDSSTTSTRSFAFPILQSEWNSSPVKMRKSDRRLQKHNRGWRLQGLLCCRF